MLGPPESEHFRTRVAFVFLIGGLVLLFWAWGSWVFRASTPAMAGRIPTAPRVLNGVSEGGLSPAERVRVVRAVWQYLLFGLVLVLLVIFGTYAIVRASRRYRAAGEEKEAKKPPDRRDAWSMHKLSPEDEESGPA